MCAIEATNWPELITRHLVGNGQLPCRVDEMTPRELAIFKVAAAHSGFLVAMRDAMSAVPGSFHEPASPITQEESRG